MKLQFEHESVAIPFVEDQFDLNGTVETSSPEIRRLLEDGIKAAKEGDRSEARYLLLRVTESEPECENAWLWLASISEYPEELMVFLNNILEINPENERAVSWVKETKGVLADNLVKRGYDAIEEKNEKIAKQCFLQAIVHDGRNEDAWLQLAAVSDSNREKISHLQKVLSINSENEEAVDALKNVKEALGKAILQKAQDAFETGEIERVEEYLIEINEADFENEEVWILKTKLETEFEQKVEYLEKALEFDKTNAEALELLSAAKTDHVETLMSKATSAFESGSEEEARELLANIFKFASENEEAWLLEVHLENSNEKKLYLLEKVLSINPQNEEATELYQKIEEDSVVSLLSQTKSAVESGEIKEATQLLQKIFEIAPEREEALFIKANLAESTEEQEKIIKQILEINPENEEALNFMENSRAKALEELLAKANAEAASGNTEKANSLLDEIFAHESKLPGAWLLKANLTDSFSEKIVCFENVLKIDPDHEVAKTTLKSLQSIQQASQTEKKLIPQGFDANGQTQELVFKISQSENGDLELETTTEDQDPENKIKDSDSDMETTNDSHEEETPDNAEDGEEVIAVEALTEEDIDLEPIGMPDSVDELTPECVADSDSEEAQPEFSIDDAIDPDETDDDTLVSFDDASSEDQQMTIACQFCKEDNTPNAFVCGICGAILSLSDIEMFFTHNLNPSDNIRKEVETLEENMESEELSFDDLHTLGLGHLNLKNFQKGHDYFVSASEIQTKDALLSAQIDALSLRISEFEESDDDSEKPVAVKNILVVDDSATIRKLISAKLEKTGYNVISAIDGVDALEMLVETAPDLVLLDVAMPRMDGYEVCKKIRENEETKDVPIIMISGKDGFFDKAKGKLAGSTDFISKPFGPETLMRTVEEYIE